MPCKSCFRPCLLLLFAVGLAPSSAFREVFHHSFGDGEGGSGLATRQSTHTGLSLKSHLSSGIDLKVVSEVMRLGIEGVQEGIASLEKEPLDLELSLGIFDDKLWKIIELVVPKEQQATPDFAKARKTWDAAFQNVPNLKSVLDSVNKYRDSGDTDALTEAMTVILDTALKSCKDAFPEQAVYFQSVEELLEGIFGSWSMFAEGKTTEAVEAVWMATKKALKDILPEDMNTDANLQFVMHSIDGVISKLSAHVLEYERLMLNSKVCYKRTTKRDRVRPSVCRKGFEWDQQHLCIPTAEGGANCLSTCGGEGGMCVSFCGKGKACCRRNYNGDPPECTGSTGYVDHDFTKGSSKDYHQCVNPGPALQFELTGCGDARVNGLWVLNGQHSGRPRYTHVNDKHTIMEWSNSRKAWRLFHDDTFLGFNRATLYQSKVDSPVLPLSGWEVVTGLYKEPVITKYAGSKASLVQENVNITRWDDFGTHEAMCDPNSDYPEKNGIWCYGKCPVGYLAKGDTTCEQVCGGTFPAEGSLGPASVCGHNPGELADATTKMYTILLNSALKFADIAAKVKEDGVKSDTLVDTINTFIDMGKPFARPMCPKDMKPEA